MSLVSFKNNLSQQLNAAGVILGINIFRLIRQNLFVTWEAKLILDLTQTLIEMA